MRGRGRAGAWFWPLFVLGSVASVVLAAADSASATAIGAVAVASSGAYLSWKVFTQGRETAATLDTASAADRLARAVGKQWDAESGLRRIYDPRPLPVAWQHADPALVEPWRDLVELARSIPGGPPGDPLEWADGPERLAGADMEIGDVYFLRVPTRRLLVLGDPGSGKTVLLIRLLQDLLARRQAGWPVPVLFSLSSWRPEHGVQDWLAEQLRRTHPGLRTVAPPAVNESGHDDLAQALLDAGLILPLLDGFDELPPALAPRALEALNRLSPRHHFVLTSRTSVYEAALASAGAPAYLNGAAGIELLPLAPDHASAYLRRDAGTNASRWNRVLDQLRADTPVGAVLGSPLGLFLARTIYNTSGTSYASAGPDTLCDTSRYPDRSAVEDHLFDAFIPTSYAEHGTVPSRWSADRARRALTFLAHRQEVHHAGSPEIAWWDLHHVVPPLLRRIVAACEYGLFYGLLNIFYNLTAPWIGFGEGFGAGLVIGVIPALGATRDRPRLRTRMHWSGDLASLQREIGSGVRTVFEKTLRMRYLWLLVGFFALMVGLDKSAWTSARPTSAIVSALIGGPVGGITLLFLGSVGLGFLEGVGNWMTNGLSTEPYDTDAIGPVELLAADRRGHLVLGLIGAPVFALCASSIFALTIGCPMGMIFLFSRGLHAAFSVLPEISQASLTLGLVGATGIGVWIIQSSRWEGLAVSRIYLAGNGKMPWRLMSFLEDAHRRGVLRQTGAVYQFSHISLQHHLAKRAPDPPTREASSDPEPAATSRGSTGD